MICRLCHGKGHIDEFEECSVCGRPACFECLFAEQTAPDNVTWICSDCMEERADNV